MNTLKLNNKEFYIIGCLFLSVLTLSCVSIKPVYFDDDKKIAMMKVDKFHQLFNDDKFDQMYDLFSLETRKDVSIQEFSKSFQQLKNETGKVKKSNVVSSDIKVEAAYRKVELIYKTEFENFTMREKFQCLVDGKDAVIDIYHKPELIPSNQ